MRFNRASRTNSYVNLESPLPGFASNCFAACATAARKSLVFLYHSFSLPPLVVTLSRGEVEKLTRNGEINKEGIVIISERDVVGGIR